MNNNLVSWNRAVLSNRTQSVTVDNTTYSSLDVISDATQGSVLGPLLFLVYVNDIASLSSSVKVYADELVLYRKFSFIEDRTILQDDLGKLTTWWDSCLMTINQDKSKIMSFSRSKNEVCFSYTISFRGLEQVDTLKYLEVYLAEDLSWKCHVT